MAGKKWEKNFAENGGELMFETLEERKLVKVLEFYLSLHEADEIFNMIFDEKFSPEDVEAKLKEFQKGSEE